MDANTETQTLGQRVASVMDRLPNNGNSTDSFEWKRNNTVLSSYETILGLHSVLLCGDVSYLERTGSEHDADTNRCSYNFQSNERMRMSHRVSSILKSVGFLDHTLAQEGVSREINRQKILALQAITAIHEQVLAPTVLKHVFTEQAGAHADYEIQLTVNDGVVSFERPSSMSQGQVVTFKGMLEDVANLGIEVGLFGHGSEVQGLKSYRLSHAQYYLHCSKTHLSRNLDEIELKAFEFELRKMSAMGRNSIYHPDVTSEEVALVLDLYEALTGDSLTDSYLVGVRGRGGMVMNFMNSSNVNEGKIRVNSAEYGVFKPDLLQEEVS